MRIHVMLKPDLSGQNLKKKLWSGNFCLTNILLFTGVNVKQNWVHFPPEGAQSSVSKNAAKCFT